MSTRSEKETCSTNKGDVQIIKEMFRCSLISVLHVEGIGVAYHSRDYEASYSLEDGF